MVDFDPTTTFPTDDITDGFDNVGEGLVTSDYLLRNYLRAAREVAEKVDSARSPTRNDPLRFERGPKIERSARHT